MFQVEFKVLEIRQSGITITHYLLGSRKYVKEQIEEFKNSYTRYEMFGKKGMTVWA